MAVGGWVFMHDWLIKVLFLSAAEPDGRPLSAYKTGEEDYQEFRELVRMQSRSSWFRPRPPSQEGGRQDDSAPPHTTERDIEISPPLSPNDTIQLERRPSKNRRPTSSLDRRERTG